MGKRLRNIDFKVTEERVLMKKETIFPEIPLSEDDIYIETVAGDRYDLLALEFYNDQELWFILAALDTEFRGSLNVKPGRQLRIPSNPDRIVQKFEQFNTNR